MRQKTNKNIKGRRVVGVCTIPESVAETPETEGRPEGEALHLGMPLNGGKGLDK